MPFSLRFLAFASLISLSASFSGARVVWGQNARRLMPAMPLPAMPSGPGALSNARIGAARALRLVDSEGKELQGAWSDPKWETRGSGLFFTRDFGGTRNIWRAFPDPRDASRYPRWRALPVTQFEAPLYARSACPIEGDRALLMISNAANPRGAAQATLFDLRKREVRALTSEPEGVSSAAPAPDAESFAYATAMRETAPRESNSRRASLRASLRRSSSELFPSVWQQNFAEGPISRQQVALKAWRPAWQGAGLLLVEGVTNRIVRLLLDNQARVGRVVSTTQIALGTQICASRDGSGLIMAGKAGDAAPLYLLSGDGSGVRALGGTEGAQSPAWSGDGQFLAFIAPLNSGNAGDPVSAQKEAALWILPLQPGETLDLLPVSGDGQSKLKADEAPLIESPMADASPSPREVATGLQVASARGAAPVARIESVQSAARGALAVFGTASGAGASATLEIGQGQSPRRWEARQVALSGAAGTPLLLWVPPGSARGIWNFRLTVSGSGGAAQSLFSVILPLPQRLAASSNASSLSTKANSVKKPSGRTSFNNSMPPGGLLPVAPLPDLPAPPLPAPAPLPRLLPAPPPRDAAPVRDTKRNTPRDSGSRDSGSNGEAAPNAPQLAPGREAAPGVPTGGRDAGVFNVSNTLAQMKAGQRLNVTFWALNRGARTWETGPVRADEGPVSRVRLVTRWLRFDNGNRNGWTYQNMKTPVSPGTRTRWNFDLVAPSQAGRYKLIYSLQRAAPGWMPPAYNAAQETWPDDFAAIAFAVTVKP